MDPREKSHFLPHATNDRFVISPSDGPAPSPEPSEAAPPPEPEDPAGRYLCPCCGYLTFPVPKEEALAYICPVCYWENDIFDPGEDAPSEENRGMTLRQGREIYRKWGAVREDLVRHARPPRRWELPPKPNKGET